MKLPWVFFALLLAMCFLVGYVFTVEESTLGHGFTHPEFGTMQRGGDGVERHAEVLWCGWLFGVLEISVFVAMLALGLRHRGELLERKWPLLFGLLLYMGVFTLIILTYQAYAAADSRPLFLSLPAPSAWMLYGLWGVPLYFHGLYVLFFDRWVLKGEDLDRFRQIVEAKRQQGTD